MAKPSLTMKLYIDTQAKKVLFAEANKGSVDFLFRILVSLPIPTLAPQLNKPGTVGSLVNHFETLENPNDSTLQSSEFVKRRLTYIVMDNLVVEPMFMSISACLALLNKFKVKDFGLLEERVVNLDMDEAVRLFEASGQSDNVNLTDLFLSGHKPAVVLDEPKEHGHESMESFRTIFMQYKHVVPEIVCSMLLEGKMEFTSEIRRQLLSRITQSDNVGVSEWIVVDP